MIVPTPSIFTASKVPMSMHLSGGNNDRTATQKQENLWKETTWARAQQATINPYLKPLTLERGLGLHQPP